MFLVIFGGTNETESYILFHSNVCSSVESVVQLIALSCWPIVHSSDVIHAQELRIALATT